MYRIHREGREIVAVEINKIDEDESESIQILVEDGFPVLIVDELEVVNDYGIELEDVKIIE